PSILAQALADNAAAQPAPPPSDPRDAGASAWEDLFRTSPVTPLDLIRGDWESYMAFQSSHEYVVASCWTLHCFVYDRFMVTPRLLFISPMENTGKTTALDVLSRLAPNPKKSDDISVAVLRYHIARQRTMLLDEVDNLDLATKRALRSAINANRRGSSYDRMGKHGPSEQSGYAPMALSSIGPLPRPQISRCIEFYLVRANEERSKLLRRFDVNDTADLDRTYQITRAWLQTAKIDPDPVMPQGFYGRRGDNWRPLVAVADACSPAWGALIREAMVHFTRGYQDKHILVLLLEHIRDVFDAYGFNTRDGKAVLSKVLVDELNAREDGPWAEWTGILDNQRPRKLTQTALAGL